MWAKIETYRIRGVTYLMTISLLLGCLALGSKGLAKESERNIVLDPPQELFHIDLGEALSSRRSTRDFIQQDVTLQDLSTVLWAANGINRKDGKRTAPAPHGKYVIDIYVAMDQGVYLYDAEQHRLGYLSDYNLKAKAGKQGDIKKAYCVLILVAKTHRFPIIVNKEDRLLMSHATAGCIGQNVYLAANALQLGTRLVQWQNEKIISEVLELQKNELPLFIMPLGYPKE